MPGGHWYPKLRGADAGPRRCPLHRLRHMRPGADQARKGRGRGGGLLELIQGMLWGPAPR
eukprot:4700987-Heterocapsa_arctica.AAC.1